MLVLKLVSDSVPVKLAPYLEQNKSLLSHRNLVFFDDFSQRLLLIRNTLESFLFLMF